MSDRAHVFDPTCNCGPCLHERGLLPTAKQPPPNENWCVGCSPDNCSGCTIPEPSTVKCPTCERDPGTGHEPWCPEPYGVQAGGVGRTADQAPPASRAPVSKPREEDTWIIWRCPDPDCRSCYLDAEHRYTEVACSNSPPHPELPSERPRCERIEVVPAHWRTRAETAEGELVQFKIEFYAPAVRRAETAERQRDELARAMNTHRIDARNVTPGMTIAGLGRVQSWSMSGIRANRIVTIWGEWGWRLILPVGKGRCDVTIEGDG